MRDSRRRILVACLLSFLAIAGLFSAFQDSQTIDEGTHLASGYSYWQTGRIKLNPEHPPLIKLLSSAPLLMLPLDFPIENTGWLQANQWDFARQFLYHNTISWRWLLFLGRLPIIFISVLLSYFVYRVSHRLFSDQAALIILSLFIIDPTFFAHGHLITTDVPLAFFVFITIIALANFLKSATWRSYIIFLLCFSAAQLTKFSAIILWLIIIIISLISIAKRDYFQINRKFTARLFILSLVGLMLLSYFLTWMFYFYEVDPVISIDGAKSYYNYDTDASVMAPTINRLGIPLVDRMLETDHWPGVTIYQLAKTFPVPALTYFRGLVDVGLHNYFGHGTYLLGQASNYGWWYYFPLALLFKTPFGIIFLFLLSALALLFNYFKKTQLSLPPGQRIVVLGMTGVGLIYFLVSLTSHINLGVRHLLPIIPLIYIFCGYIIDKYVLLNQITRKLILLFIITSYVAFSLLFPNQLSYFSEIVGGSRQGPKYLLDSNFDWGQGFNELNKYLKQNNINNYYGAFFTSIDLSAIGIHFKQMPTNEYVKINGAPSGTYIISAGILFDPNMPFSWLTNYTPRTRIRDSIYVYYIE